MGKEFRNERHRELYRKVVEIHNAAKKKIGDELIQKNPSLYDSLYQGHQFFLKKYTEYVSKIQTKEYSKLDLPFYERVLINIHNLDPSRFK